MKKNELKCWTTMTWMMLKLHCELKPAWLSLPKSKWHWHCGGEKDEQWHQHHPTFWYKIVQSERCKYYSVMTTFKSEWCSNKLLWISKIIKLFHLKIIEITLTSRSQQNVHENCVITNETIYKKLLPLVAKAEILGRNANIHSLHVVLRFSTL